EDPINPVYCASIDGLVKTQLNRACVDVRYFVPNENNPPNATRSGNTWTDIDLDTINQGRDCNYNSQTFWSTRVVSVPAQVSDLISEYGGTSSGYFSASSNRICLVSDSMGPWINTWNVNHDTYVTLASYLEVTLLHEIGHWFELAHEQNVFFSADEEAVKGEFESPEEENQNPDDPEDDTVYYIHADDNEPDPIGVMNYLFRYTLPMPPIEPVLVNSPSGVPSYVALSAEPDVSRIIEYAYFTDANLTDIQKYGGE
ncbi:MAG: hypothetical protein PHE53_09580, partial [Thermoguttaceae bacterium]|nr:hypothetical protein [Thermoguttaceae bacterium]